VFEGFTLSRVAVSSCVLRVQVGGHGPAVLLLHGHPRTHVTWHWVAELLADRFTVVCPDLRGYGQSSKPATTTDHEPYGKRAMAQDCRRSSGPPRNDLERFPDRSFQSAHDDQHG
jgi:haloacetate dehalogenase